MKSDGIADPPPKLVTELHGGVTQANVIDAPLLEKLRIE